MVTRLILSLVIFSLYGFSVVADDNKVVIGTDERTPVASAVAHPFRYVGHVATLCTGFMVSPRHFITAGHCLTDFETKTWQWGLYFSPMRQGHFLPMGMKNWKKAWVHREYFEKRNSVYDFGLVELKEPVGNKLGWFDLGLTSSITGETLPVTIAGYPGDKPVGSFWRSSCIAQRNDEYWDYQCDTAGGMSGAPVFTERGGRPVVVGVHILGDEEKNQATWLNEEKLKLIRAWMRNLSPAGTMTYSNPFEDIRDPWDKLTVTNDCEGPVRVTLYYRNLNKEWVLEKDKLYHPGMNNRFDMISTSRFYFAASSSSRRWEGGKGCKELEELPGVCLSRFELTDPNWAEYDLKFCSL